MVMNSAYKNIHTHTLAVFQIPTYGWVLLGLSVTNACEQSYRKTIIILQVKLESSNVQGCD